MSSLSPRIICASDPIVDYVATAPLQLVELKAELFRRKAEYDREKTDPAERAAAKAKAKV